MSEMVTVRTRKLWTCLPGKPRWIAGRQQTGIEMRTWFLADQSSHLFVYSFISSFFY